MPQTGGVADVIAFAEKQLGKPYQFGAVGPKAYDCSGLLVAAYSTIGVTLPHFTGTMVSVGTAVNKAQLVPGDLVFPDSHHVQLYVGDGNVIEAPHTGAVVRRVKMWGFWKARRVVGGGTNYIPAGASNPLIPDSIENLGAFLTDEDTWVRAGWYVAGAVFIIIGLVLLSVPAIAPVAKIAGKVKG